MDMKLPKPVPQQIWRPSDPNIPDSLEKRQFIKKLAIDYVLETTPTPPLPLSELARHGKILCEKHGVEEKYENFAAILINNAIWEEELAGIPFENRLLLLPKCLRKEDTCPAPFDEFGLLCKTCGQCSLQDLQAEAERLGYATLIAEGSALVTAIIETGKIEAIVGVSCVSVLEKAFPFMEAAAIPGVAIPLLQGDCRDTNVDMEWVWDIIHLSSEDRTRRLNLDKIKTDVQSWFTIDELDRLMGTTQNNVERLARTWLAKDGKRWRPFLTACVYQALQDDPTSDIPDEIKKIAIAVECFHKASLIHDDIEDDDAERYGEQTLHEEHGLPIALNAGDLLIGEGYRMIAQSGCDGGQIGEMVSVAAESQRQLCFGQGKELYWMQFPKPLSPEEVASIFAEKTAPAFETSLLLGALAAKADPSVLPALKTYSKALGVAYQMNDDLDDDFLLGESQPIRPSILMALAYRQAKGDLKPFLKELHGKNLTATEAQKLVTIFKEMEIPEQVENMVEAYRFEAVQVLYEVDNANLKGLLRRVIEKILKPTEIKEWCREFETRNAADSETVTAFVV